MDFKQTKVPFKDTGLYPKLIIDYIAGHKSVSEFFNLPFTAASFASQPIVDPIRRNTLTSVLKDQYLLSGGCSVEVAGNIDILNETDTYTITTGHQPCIFTGPFYFIIKIIHVINLTRKLSALYPGKHFVPVFWMATEDHDLEEIDHFYLYGKKYCWETGQTGPAGRISTQGLDSIIDQLNEKLNTSENGLFLADLFKRAYSGKNNLADATRIILNELFGKYGLVILNPDNPALKKEFMEIMKHDLLGGFNLPFVEHSIKGLESHGFHAQAHPREINLFYLTEHGRFRIEKTGDEWKTIGHPKSWNREEIISELNEHPENFSPNVILRPMYQQTVLPNLAYIGGPGETAYWLELKEMFERNKIHFPVIGLRRSVMWIEEEIHAIMIKYGMKIQDLWNGSNAFIKNKLMDEGLNLETYREQLHELFNKLSYMAAEIDVTLVGSVDSEQKKALNGIDHIQEKLIRASKRKNEVLTKQVNRVFDTLQPGGILNERKEGFISLYLKHGEGLFDILLNDEDPFSSHLNVIEFQAD